MTDIGLDRFEQTVDGAADDARLRLGERGELTTARHSFGGRVVRWLARRPTRQDRVDNQRLMGDLLRGLQQKYGDIGTEAFLRAVPEGIDAAAGKPLTARQVRNALTHAETTSRNQLTSAARARAVLYSPGHRKFSEIADAVGIDPATLTKAQRSAFKNKLLRRIVAQATATGTQPGLAEVAGLAKQALRQTLHLPRPPSEIAGPVERALAAVAAGDGDRDRLQALATELGNHLAGQLRRLDREQQLDAVMSRGDEAKEELLRQLAQQLPQPGILAGSYKSADPVVRRFLDDVYQHAVTNLSDRRIDDQTVVVGGKTYTKDRELARGSFGTVDLYEAESGEKIVIKTPLGDGFDEAADELSAHRWAAGGDPTNLIGLRGALRTPDGVLQIALEYAPRGDAQDLIGGIDTALATGRITQQQANLVRLTLLKDMAQGVQHVQVTRGMVHLDVKAPNFFVDADGVAKLGDFGTATQGKVREMYRSPIDNPLWTSPELAKGSRETKRRSSQTFQQYRAARRAALANLDQLELSSEELTALRKNISSAYDIQIQHEFGTFEVTGKTDTWSLGVDAYRMFVGRYPFGQKGDRDLVIERAVIDYQERGTPLGLPQGARIGLGPLDRRQLDTLLRGMLHPDPKQRPSLEQVLANPLLAQPEVGGPEARRLIRQLTEASPRSTES